MFHRTSLFIGLPREKRDRPCRSNPLAGARVNVLGTLAVFEAAAASPKKPPIAYASSAAVFGSDDFQAGVDAFVTKRRAQWTGQ